jgi:sialidase-1
MKVLTHGLLAVFVTGVLSGGAQTSTPGSPLALRGQWVIDGEGEGWTDEGLRLSNLPSQTYAFYRGAACADMDLRVRFKVDQAGNGVKAAGLVLHSRDSLTGYLVHYDTKNDQIILSRGRGGERRELTRRKGIKLDTDRWYSARTTAIAGKIDVYLDDQLLVSAQDVELKAGLAGLYTSQGTVEFRELVLGGQSATPPAEWKLRKHYEVPTNQSVATIHDISVIAKQPGRYIGWPTVCRKRNGELLAVFSGDRSQHVCPWGKVQLVRSYDSGKTWTEPVSICNTPLDDRDAGILETAKGTLVVAWFTSLAFESSMKSSWLKGLEGGAVLEQWRLHAEKLTPEIRQKWLGYWTRRSEDNGKTWGEPVQTAGSAPHGGIELADGRLLYVGRRNPHRKDSELTVEESRDDGRSWQQIGSVAVDPGDSARDFHEPHVVEAADGTLVAMFRHHWSDPKTRKRDGRKDYLRQSISTDGGKSWTVAKASPLLGYPPHLIRLKNDAIVCVYGRRTSPYGQYACASWDNGKTWDTENEIKLASAMNSDLGYPASTQLEDSSILTVYYQIHQAGEKTCLMGTRWSLKGR